VKKGSHRALVFDVLEPCLQRADALGADKVVNLRNADPLRSIHDFTNGEGANVIFECAGKASNFPILLEGVSICGRIVVVGLLFDSIPLVPFTLIRKRIGILGTRNSNMIPQAIELLKERPEIPEYFISHRMPFHEAKKGFQLLQQRSEDICKIMLLWE
jgi:L-iditol 2-dehydrogenase